MKISEFARALKVSESAIRKGCGNGRLRLALTRDERGRVVAIDETIGRREWEGNRTRLPPRTARPVPGAAAILQRLLAIVAEVQIDTRGIVATYLPHVVEGAAEALRAAGQPTTAAASGEALCLADGLDGHGLTIASALIGAVEDPDSTPETIRELARREGAAAVAWRCSLTTKGGTTDGEE